jgi:putative membrane protein
MLGRWPIEPALWLSLALSAALYAAGVRSLRRRCRRWSAWRTACFTGGLLVIAAALASPLTEEDERFWAHMVQHMLLGMLAPLLLALSAPVTLALRTLPKRRRRALVAALRTRVVQVLAHPATATTLFVAGLLGLYLTPLYGETSRHPLLHEAVHLHFLLSGCLLTWSFVGLDPVPRHGGLAMRIGLLAVALGTHAALAKALYAGYGSIDVRADELHLGAKIMYYGGDAIYVALLTVFFLQWYAAGGRQIEHQRRRELRGAPLWQAELPPAAGEHELPVPAGAARDALAQDP